MLKLDRQTPKATPYNQTQDQRRMRQTDRRIGVRTVRRSVKMELKQLVSGLRPITVEE